MTFTAPRREKTFRLLLSTTLLAVVTPCLARGAGPIGWRGDGSGSYPGTTPPLKWSPDENVVWKTPMPGASNSLPVLIGHRIFICAEPGTLLCLHREDGRVLWQKTCSYDDLALEPEVRQRLEVELKEAERLATLQAEVSRESQALRRKLKEDPARKEEIEKKVHALKERGEALAAQRQKLTLAIRYTRPRTHGVAGYSTPTPVTDGKNVFVALGDGLVACFDLDGSRQWLKLIEHSTAPYAHGGSPVLVGDLLVIQFADLVALRQKDGSECWRVRRPPPHGTPLAASIGGRDILITPRGMVLRAEDGSVLAEGLGSCGANSPLVHDGKVYFVRNTVSAIRLPRASGSSLEVEKLWTARIKGSGYWFSSPVLHDGLLYATNDQGLLSVLEADTGKVVYEQRVGLEGTSYPSISMAGNRVYVSSDQGMTVVLQPGREYRELARNRLEPFRSSLVFEGKRVYIRTQKHLYCIGE